MVMETHIAAIRDQFELAADAEFELAADAEFECVTSKLVAEKKRTVIQFAYKVHANGTVVRFLVSLIERKNMPGHELVTAELVEAVVWPWLSEDKWG